MEDASLLVEQHVGQNATDNATLVPLVEAVERRCRERPQKVSADSGFFCLETIVELAQRGLDVYVPDSNLARELNRGQRAPGAPAGYGIRNIGECDASCATRPAGRFISGARRSWNQ